MTCPYWGGFSFPSNLDNLFICAINKLMMRIVIVGLSAAGLSALETLIKHAKDCSITVITEERYEPYSRCLLTHYLGKELTLGGLFISKTSSYPSNVNCIFGRKVVSIEKDANKIQMDDGTHLFYDKLLLATGAEPVKPDYAAKSNRVFTLRHIEDANKIEGKLEDKATVVGGGFVGIKTAYGLIEREVKVNLVISSGYPLSVILDEETGKLIETELKNLGISVYTKSDVFEIAKKPKGVYSLLSSNKTLESDVIIVGKGVKPRLELAESAGIAIKNGILVNEFMETSVKNIFAAGDCVEAYDIARNETFINAIWPNAVEQGYFAAMNMLGSRMKYYGSIGYNSLKTKTFHLISAGVLKGKDIKTYQHYIPSRRQLRKIAFRGDIPVGMAFLNSPNDAGVMVNLIKRAKPLDVKPEEAVKGDFSLLQNLF